MAAALDISPSYLNLIERGQRPLSAAIIVRLADRFGFDAASLADPPVAGGVAAMRRRLADPRFADLDIDAREVEEWLGAMPGIATAFARLFDGGGSQVGAGQGHHEAEPVRLVRREIERWSNHFADLDAHAERLADDLRLVNPDLYGAITDRLRSHHQIAIRILPADVMPDRLRRLDLHARQLQLSEMLGPQSRAMEAAGLLAQIEAKAQVDALVAGARRCLTGARCGCSGVTCCAITPRPSRCPTPGFCARAKARVMILALLERRFGIGFEQIAHRLTTLQRVGARGLPFMMLRFDRAGQASKRFAGASGSPLVDGAVDCAVWGAHRAFDRAGTLRCDRVELEDGSRWLTFARTVYGPARDAAGRGAEHVIALGVEERLAGIIVGEQLAGPPVPIGLGCSQCTRSDCIQRATPPVGRPLIVNDRERTVLPFEFASGGQ